MSDTARPWANDDRVWACLKGAYVGLAVLFVGCFLRYGIAWALIITGFVWFVAGMTVAVVADRSLGRDNG